MSTGNGRPSLWTAPEPPRSGIELRDYQVDALEELRRGIRAGHRRQILCAPTGSGKTVIAGAMIREAVKRGSRVAFLADRRALVIQTSERLAEAGIRHGMKMAADRTFGESELVQVCSAQTLERRGIGRYELVVVDEAHSRRRAIERSLVDAGVVVVGLTATPFAAGLGKVYSRVVNARTTDALTKEGWLVPVRVFCAREIDMAGAATDKRGEWTSAAAEERALPIVGDVVSEWQRYTRRMFGGPAKTLVFSATVAHGEELKREFNAAGFRFDQISYRDGSDSARDMRIADFRAGRLDGLISCEALNRGFDAPDVLCLVAARPYRRSVTNHIQQLGRVMRSSPGKSYGLVLDHAGNYLRHAHRTEEFWAEGCSELDDGRKRPKSARPERRAPSERRCRECQMVAAPGAQICAYCGAAMPRRQARVPVRAGTMQEYRRTPGGHGDIWPDICRLAEERYRGPDAEEKRRKWARAQHRTVTGRWPAREFVAGADCRPEVEQMVMGSFRKWVRQQRAIRRKARKEQAAEKSA